LVGYVTDERKYIHCVWWDEKTAVTTLKTCLLKIYAELDLNAS